MEVFDLELLQAAERLLQYYSWKMQVYLTSESLQNIESLVVLCTPFVRINHQTGTLADRKSRNEKSLNTVFAMFAVIKNLPEMKYIDVIFLKFLPVNH